jgi:hypothetical protein
MKSLTTHQTHLQAQNIFHSETTLGGHPAIVGYEKQFRWSWMATQLNCFIVVVDCGDTPVTAETFETLFPEAHAYAKEHYTGWPKGLQSGVGVVLLLTGTEVSQDAQDYCTELKAGKKWAGFSVPLARNTANGQGYLFEKKPMWGRIYFGYFQELATGLLKA